MDKSRSNILYTIVLLVLALMLLDNPYLKEQARFWRMGRYVETPAVTEEWREKVGEPNRLTIPSLRIEAPIVYAETVSEAEFQERLQKGVVHYPGTVLPGEYGNCYIFGHSSDYPWTKGEYKAVFALLPNVQTGDLVTVTGPDGKVFTYAVTASFQASANATELLSQGDRQNRLLTLQTSYPLGTALRRWIVQAEMIRER